MNILQIGTTDKRGGAALVSWKIKDALDSKGIKNSMFVADKLSDNTNIHEIKRSKLKKYLSVLTGKDQYKTDWILKTKEFKEADIVHFHNIHGRYFNLSTFQKICKLKKVVWTLHDEWAITPHCVYTLENKICEDGYFKCPNNQMPERIFWFNKNKTANFKKNILLTSNFHLVSPSTWLKNKVEQSYLKEKNISLIYNGIDNRIFKKIDKNKARQELGLPLDKKIIFSLSDGGANGPTWKGWQYTKKIIESFQNNSNIIFLCAGNEAKQKNSKNIIYTGIIENKKLYKYFSASDMLLNTSLADNFPLIALESMSCGLPIVSFDTGGIKEAVIHKKNGRIAKYQDINDVIKNINKIINLTPDEYKQMSQNCIERVNKKFTSEKMVENYINLYNSLLK